MNRTIAGLMRMARPLMAKGEVEFFSRAATASYAEVQEVVKAQSKMQAKVEEIAGKGRVEPEGVVDAEGAWKYIMESGLVPQDKKGAEYKNPETGEIGGYASLPEPTRYGDWEKAGICYDF
eukprot:NODE_10383_length_595_cov_94.406780_g10109_i0.p1 GENE.NODE_10383_length_595_cov_94.406780_g10109_i0~~NODE_10383_length_595_cov_94.406780_g10109_i0.p1  ORF type:complete len:141 (+),score=41.61 NODE_10383_length_595_cov_94.406780_g10109_i0:63-425(+)